MVGVIRVQREQRCPVVQDDSGAGNNHPRPEVGEYTVDERAGIALSVDHADINGVRAIQYLPVGHGGHSLLGVHQCPPGDGEIFGGQLLDGHVGLSGVGHILEGVGESQAHRLDQVVIGIR